MVNGSVGGIKLAGQIIETNIAPRSMDPLLSGGGDHRVEFITSSVRATPLAGILLSFPPAVSIAPKTKIRYNGQEYFSASQLPRAIRVAYEKALHEGAVKKKFVFNGEQFASEEDKPADVRKLCDDVMGVVENNGEVTIGLEGVTSPNPHRALYIKRLSAVCYSEILGTKASAQFRCLDTFRPQLRPRI